jgi:hypothetical protein
MSDEKHYTAVEVAKQWGVSSDLVSACASTPNRNRCDRRVSRTTVPNLVRQRKKEIRCDRLAASFEPAVQDLTGPRRPRSSIPTHLRLRATHRRRFADNRCSAARTFLGSYHRTALQRLGQGSAGTAGSRRSASFSLAFRRHDRYKNGTTSTVKRNKASGTPIKVQGNRWWRRGELNPRPKSAAPRSLHAYLSSVCFAGRA